MNEEKDRQGTSETRAEENPPSEGNRPGPTWRAWVVAIVVAIVLSVTATLMLGGSASFRPGGGAASQGAGSGCGGSCCPPADAGK